MKTEVLNDRGFSGTKKFDFLKSQVRAGGKNLKYAVKAEKRDVLKGSLHYQNRIAPAVSNRRGNNSMMSDYKKPMPRLEGFPQMSQLQQDKTLTEI